MSSLYRQAQKLERELIKRTSAPSRERVIDREMRSSINHEGHKKSTNKINYHHPISNEEGYLVF
jgi:hypothetical protein